MQTIFRQQWADDFTFWCAVEYLNEVTDTHLIYVGVEEAEATHNHPRYQGIDFPTWVRENQDIFTRNNNRLTMVDGAGSIDPDSWYAFMEDFPGCEIVHWPGFWLEHSNYYRTRLDVSEYADEFEYAMVCMMHRPHPHRGAMMTELIKRTLHQTELVSWHGRQADQGNANDPYDIDPVLLQGVPGQIQENEIVLYDRAFCDLVVESNAESIFYTEKTHRPLLFGKVFLIMGYQGMNIHLRDMGFEIFDEIFDYSFDTEPDTEIRASMIAEQIERIQGLNYNDLFERVRHKVEHNKEHIKKIQREHPTRPAIMNLPGIPDQYKLDYHHDEYQADLAKLLRGEKLEF